MADEEGRSSEGQALSEEIAECCGCIGRRSSSGKGKNQQTAEEASCIRRDGNQKLGTQPGIHTGSIWCPNRQPEQIMCKSPLPRLLCLQRSMLLGQRLTQPERARRISSYPRRSYPPAWRWRCPRFQRPPVMGR